MDIITSEDVIRSQESKQYRKYLEKKFLNKGLDDFYEKEILDLLLAYTITKGEVNNISEALLRKFGNLCNIIEASVEELVACPKMDVHSAVLLKLAKSFGEYYLKNKILKKSLGNCRLDIINYCISNMSSLKDEEFRVIFMNCQNEVIEIETLHEGTINQAVVYPRKVMERALYHKAGSLILVHNHPSGKAKPSAADRDVTEQLVLAGSSMDIIILDHIIIAKKDYYSFFESGLLNPLKGGKYPPSTFTEEPRKQALFSSRAFSTLKEEIT